jgi:hypothetical protein
MNAHHRDHAMQTRQAPRQNRLSIACRDFTAVAAPATVATIDFRGPAGDFGALWRLRHEFLQLVCGRLHLRHDKDATFIELTQTR